ncbi:hypothetical protein P9747_16995 [Paenibacillus macerans]|nr:hypothetical protein [Paenibacillus macerans]MBS5909142.1 hypothetical protein [Paenibacillus macerans]MDU5946461.1 hypothetical protein [Paenibacillus macerans]MED4956400.1 hypothetical protein [Paenibacillus macerans]
MEINAGTELQPFNSRFNSKQDCKEALIAMKWQTASSARVALTPGAAV